MQHIQSIEGLKDRKMILHDRKFFSDFFSQGRNSNIIIIII